MRQIQCEPITLWNKARAWSILLSWSLLRQVWSSVQPIKFPIVNYQQKKYRNRLNRLNHCWKHLQNLWKAFWMEISLYWIHFIYRHNLNLQSNSESNWRDCGIIWRKLKRNYWLNKYSIEGEVNSNKFNVFIDNYQIILNFFFNVCVLVYDSRFSRLNLNQFSRSPVLYKCMQTFPHATKYLWEEELVKIKLEIHTLTHENSELCREKGSTHTITICMNSTMNLWKINNFS